MPYDNIKRLYARTTKDYAGKMRDRTLSQNAERNATTELIEHKSKYKKLYDELKTAKDIRDDNTVAVCFEYIQNLPFLHISVQKIFYINQL